LLTLCCKSTSQWYGTLSTKEKINIILDNLPPFRTSPIDIRSLRATAFSCIFSQDKIDLQYDPPIGSVTRLNCKKEFDIVRSKENPLSNHPRATKSYSANKISLCTHTAPEKKRPLAWS